MSSKTKKKSRLEVVPNLSPVTPVPPPQPVHRPFAIIQQEAVNLMSVIGSKHYTIRALEKEIETLSLHAEKLDGEAAASQAFYALQEAQKKQGEQK